MIKEVNCIKLRTVIAAVITASLLLSACSAPQPPDSGTTSGLVEKLTLKELVAQSDWIVIGTVTGKESQWTADHSRIFTSVTVSVEEWVKGGPGENEIVITTPGGQVGEAFEWEEDAAGFEEGERVLVYLRLNDDGTASVFGGWQGKFVVTKDRKVARGELSLSDLSLDELISQIKAEVDKQSK